MKRLLLGAATLNQTPMDWDGNTERILHAIQTAKEQQAHVLCLPELCITGYGCEDMFLAPHVWRTAWQMLQKIVPHTRGMIVSVGLPLFITNGVYNTACHSDFPGTKDLWARLPFFWWTRFCIQRLNSYVIID